jgi:hypothetical protein
VVADKIEGGEPLDLVAVETSLEGVVDLFERGVVTEQGTSYRPLYGPVTAVISFAAD